MPDAIALLKDLRPEEVYEADPATLERILAMPAPRARRRRPWRQIAVAATAAAVVAVALTPLLGGSPDVVARAAAALNDSESILHFTATWSGPRPAEGTIEVWRADGGRTERIASEEGEIAEDDGTWTAYDRVRNEIRRGLRLPRQVSGFEARTVLGDPSVITDDLAALLERARRGDAGVRMLSDATVRGVPVHRVQIDVDVPQPGAKSVTTGEIIEPGHAVHVERIVSVDRESYLPVRVEERAPGLARVTDYTDFERLPRTPANEQLLRLAPHPGATEAG